MLSAILVSQLNKTDPFCADRFLRPSDSMSSESFQQDPAQSRRDSQDSREHEAAF